MNNFFKYFLTLLIFTFILLIFKYNYLLNASVIMAVDLWLNKIFPSLFIMFILNDIIINLGLFNNFTNKFDNLFNKLFNIKNHALKVIILSIFSGTPTNAFIIKEMLNKKEITVDDANKLIAYTYFSNPLFLYNILTVTFSLHTTLKIILIHYFTNFIIAFIFRFKVNKSSESSVTSTNNPHRFNLSESIKKSMNTLIMILGTITFYLIITNILVTILKLNNYEATILKGFFEVTQGLNNLSLLPNYRIVKEIIALSIISFGGLSIHTQVSALINNTHIRYHNFLIGRILHVLISTITYLFITYYTSC